MSKGNTFENDLLNLIFRAVAIPNLADNAATSPLTSLYVALHTADPGEGGNQTTFETTYTGYARTAVARPAGWTVPTAGAVSPVANIDFPVDTAAGLQTITHFSVGTALTGAGKILYSGPVTPNIPVNIDVMPRLGTATVISED